MKIYLARHGQCRKNLAEVPGGPGADLTSQGRREAQLLASSVGALKSQPSYIAACPVVQAIETANIVANGLNIPSYVESALTSIHLGELAGVPVEEARQRYPSSSASMDDWRAGRAEICDLKIEGMEDPHEFYLRGIQYLDKYLQRGEVGLVIGTRSILILLNNLLDRKGIEPGRGVQSARLRKWVSGRNGHITADD